MDWEALADAGLTNAEAKVYLAMVELGTSTAGPIIQRTNLQSSVVHMALINLMHKGFASSIKEGKKSHYQPANPRHILEYIDEKRDRLEKLIPKLTESMATAKDTPEVTTFRDIRGMKELLYELLEAGGKEHHTFGSSSESLMLGEEWWIRYHKKRAARGIKAKLLFNESLAYWKPEVKYPKSQIKYTRHGFEPLTETIIRNDKVGILIWMTPPVGVLMRHKTIAESYDKFFNIIWNAAKSNKA